MRINQCKNLDHIDFSRSTWYFLLLSLQSTRKEDSDCKINSIYQQYN